MAEDESGGLHSSPDDQGDDGLDGDVGSNQNNAPETSERKVTVSAFKPLGARVLLKMAQQVPPNCRSQIDRPPAFRLFSKVFLKMAVFMAVAFLIMEMAISIRVSLIVGIRMARVYLAGQMEINIMVFLKMIS